MYVPFCGLATIEALSGVDTGVTDPVLHEVTGYGYQSLQPHQDEVIKKAEAVVEGLKSKMAARDTAK